MTDPTTQTQLYPFDTRPLTDPIDSHAMAEFWRAQRAKHPTSAAQIVIWVVVGLVFLLVFVAVVGTMLFAGIAIGAGHDSGIGLGFSIPVIVMLAIVVVGVPLAILGYRRGRVNAYRIARFAQANGMVYEHRVDAPALPGMIFQNGSSRMATSLVRGFQPRFVEFANYQYTTGSGKNRTTHRWGYVAVKLDVPLPNIVLDALGNNALGSNLPASFARDQRLSLEGDFDRHFTLYCPEGYEADALYLFTPDIMARFIDHAAQLDVEIVDDWMFLYMQREASTTDAATWAWLFGAVGALMTKFDQWARWRDDRLRQAQADAAQHPTSDDGSLSLSKGPVPPPATPLPFAAPAGMLAPPPGVAAPGRRLKKSVSWVTIVIFALVFLFMIVPQLLGGVFGFLLN